MYYENIMKRKKNMQHFKNKKVKLLGKKKIAN